MTTHQPLSKCQYAVNDWHGWRECGRAIIDGDTCTYHKLWLDEAEETCLKRLRHGKTHAAAPGVKSLASLLQIALYLAVVPVSPYGVLTSDANGSTPTGPSRRDLTAQSQ